MEGVLETWPDVACTSFCSLHVLLCGAEKAAYLAHDS